MLDVELGLIPSAKPSSDGARVRVHVASAEALARVRLLGRDRACLPVARRSRSSASSARSWPGAATGLIRAPTRRPPPSAARPSLDPLPPNGAASQDRSAALERLSGRTGPAEAAHAIVEAGAAGIEAPRLAARRHASRESVAAALAAQLRRLVALGQRTRR